MRFCQICGSELTPDATSCPICGSAVAAQPIQAPVQQPANPQPPKKAKKKKKNLALKITAAVLALVILAVSGLFIADNIMYKNEIEAVEYITDFPVLKTETDFVVFDEEDFPSTNYSITVERVLYGGVLKSELFKQTKIIIDDESTDSVYHIDFEEDGEYIITLEDNTEEESETTIDSSTDTEYVTDTDEDNKKDDDDTPSKVVIKVTVDDSDDEALDSVNLDSKPGDDPVEIPSDDKDTETDSENFIKATDADFAKFQKFASDMYWLSFQGMEDIEYNSKDSSAQYVVDNLIFDPFKKGYGAFYTIDEDVIWQAGDPLSEFNGAYKIPEEYVEWICENIYNVKYENLAEDEFTYSQTDYQWHYLHDGYYYHNDAPIGDPLDWEVTVTGAKLVNNRYEFTVESRAHSFEDYGDIVFSCNKTVTAVIKEIDGERCWSIYSIKNTDKTETDRTETDKTEDKTENTDRPTSVDAYTRDAEIYTDYLTGGELDNIISDLDRAYVDIETCMADFNGDGTHELVLAMTYTESPGLTGYYSQYAAYAIIGGSVTKIHELEYGGGSGGGDRILIKYDTEHKKHVIVSDLYYKEGLWAGFGTLEILEFNGSTLETTFKTEFQQIRYDAEWYSEDITKVKNETSYWFDDDDYFCFFKVNDSYVTEEEYIEAEARFTEPTDSAYQMKKCTYSNPLGL